MIVIELQDCFFTIPVHPEDKKRFAFFLAPNYSLWSPSSISVENSASEYDEFTTLCQLYVDAALNLVRHFWPYLYISHYMDDILFAGPDIEELESLLKVLPT